MYWRRFSFLVVFLGVSSTDVEGREVAARPVGDGVKAVALLERAAMASTGDVNFMVLLFVLMCWISIY